MITAYRERRELMMRRLRAIPGLTAIEPDGTFYVFVRYDVPMTSTEVTAALKAAGVLVRPGAEYGPSGEGHVRLSFAADIDDLEAAMDRVARCVDELRARHVNVPGV